MSSYRDLDFDNPEWLAMILTEPKEERGLKFGMTNGATLYRRVLEKAAEFLRTIPQAQQHSPAGNAAALREAVENLVAFACDTCKERLCEDDAADGEDGQPRDAQPCNAILKARDAIAAQARNCDVGTTEEQDSRFEKFCKAQDGCAECPVRKKWRKNPKSCAIIWAQMPFEEKPMEGGNP